MNSIVMLLQWLCVSKICVTAINTKVYGINIMVNNDEVYI